MKQKVYISGKITGMPNLNRFKFKAAKELLLDKGFTAINPHEIPDNHDKSWESYMKNCIIMLMTCDCVFVLDDWKLSRGAVLEVLIACFLGLKIYSIETFEETQLSIWVKLKLILNLI